MHLDTHHTSGPGRDVPQLLVEPVMPATHTDTPWSISRVWMAQTRSNLGVSSSSIKRKTLYTEKKKCLA